MQQLKEQTSVVIRTRDDCRMCGGTRLAKIWSFGKTPLANNYLAAAGDDDPIVPLNVYKCNDCHLVQLRDVVDPEVIFGDYLYVSSTSPKFVAHFEDYAEHLIERFGLTDKDLVVDVGSNDGILLKPLQQRGVRVLGIEPAKNIAQQANKDGIKTVPEFLTPKIAKKIAAEYGKAKVALSRYR